jgi:diguanylate cyclase (GGDEF)-like protein
LPDDLKQISGRKDHEAFAQALDALGIAVCLFDRGDRTVLWNSAFLEFFPEHQGHVYCGEPYSENLFRFYSNRLRGDERANIERYVADGLARHRVQSRPFVFTHRGRRLLVAARPMPDGGRVRIWRPLPETGAPADIPASLEQFPIDMLEYMADGATVLDPSGHILAANAEFRALYDIDPGQSAIGLTLVEVVRQAWEKAGLSDPGVEATFLDNLRFVGAPFEIELPGDRWRRVIARDHRRQGVVYFTHTDITALRRALAELAAIATTDGLTGLMNRRRFDQLLDEECRRAGREATPLSLILIDIDHFKSVNDGFGHPAGDACLRRVARIIDASIRRPSDSAARLGGDEFAVLLPNTPVAGAWRLAKTIQAGLAGEPWTQIDAAMAPVTASIGVLGASRAGPMDASEILRQADAMLYRAKQSGRNRIEGHPADPRTRHGTEDEAVAEHS